jgi:hypothetical protein
VRLDLDEVEPIVGDGQRIDLIELTVVCRELEVGPDVVWLAVR